LEKIVDLRSDTVTKPSLAMREIMAKAEVGDDVYGEDPTVRQLEEMAAAIMGKEAGLFVVSGTMGNQVALLAHTSRGDEIILEANAHIYTYEVGALAVLGGLLPKLIEGNKGKISPEQLKKAIRPLNIHFPQTTLLCLENTSNFGGGTVISVEEMDQLTDVAHGYGLKVHLDGARIFNAAVYLGVPVRELVKGVDSVMFCLAKGLGAPVGSVLVGSKEFIEKARKYRKMLGGGLRQSGILAAAGIYALENNIKRLAYDHLLARKLAEGLAELPGLYIDLDTVQTNILMVDIVREDLNSTQLVDILKDEGVLSSAISEKRVRFVTHRDVGDKDIDYTLQVMSKIMMAK